MPVLHTTPTIIKPRRAHIWQREKADHYVEPEWLSVRLFEVEDFRPTRLLWDPCCGWGRISNAAQGAGYRACSPAILLTEVSPQPEFAISSV